MALFIQAAKPLAWILAGFIACAPLAGCAALPAIVTVAAIVNEAITWIDVIADFVRAQPVAESDRSRIDQAVARARIAAAAVQHLARGAESVDKRDTAAAFAEFRAAYQALLDLTAPLGVRQAPAAGMMGAAPLGVSNGLLTVPSAADFGGPDA